MSAQLIEAMGSLPGEATSSTLVALYNTAAILLGEKQFKKFHDRETALRRVAEIRERLASHIAAKPRRARALFHQPVSSLSILLFAAGVR